MDVVHGFITHRKQPIRVPYKYVGTGRIIEVSWQKLFNFLRSNDFSIYRNHDLPRNSFHNFSSHNEPSDTDSKAFTI